MLQDVALVVLHVNVEDEPLAMLSGLAEICTVGADEGGAAVTVTVALPVVVPSAPLAVMV